MTIDVSNPPGGVGLTALTPNVETGTVPTNNIKYLAQMMKYIKITGDGTGTLSFPKIAGAPTVWAIDRPIFLLPNINFNNGTTTNPADVTIKNVTSADPYWLAPVIYGGYESPSIGYQTPTTNETNPTFYGFNGRWPVKGDNYIMVGQAGYNHVALGDEIRLLSASNAKNDGNSQVIPNYSFKAVITTRTTGGGWYYLGIKCDTPAWSGYTVDTIPVGLPQEATNKCAKQWGTVTLGNPAWYLVKDYYSLTNGANQGNPIYWADPDRDGYQIYSTIPGWTPGKPSRYNNFNNITLWSKYNNVMYRGLPSRSNFTNCVFKGKACIYGNGQQQNVYTNCVGEFWDTAVEFGYNSWFITMTNNTFTYNAGLTPPGGTINRDLGIFVAHERANEMLINGSTIGVTIDVGTRQVYYVDANNNVHTSPLFQISGENMDFNTVHATLMQYKAALFDIRKDLPSGISNAPTKNITFGANVVTFDMNNNYFTQFSRLVEESDTIAFSNVSFTEQNTATTDTNRLILNDNTIKNITLTNVALQTVAGASGSGLVYVSTNLTGATNNIDVYRSCKFGGVTGAALDNVLPGLAGFAENGNFTGEASQIELKN